MEFPDLGKHCSLPDCAQLDYLPFECAYCSKEFCKKHWPRDQHDCQGKPLNLTFITCPVCQRSIKYNEGSDNPDEIVDRHIGLGECSDSGNRVRNECTYKICHKIAIIKCAYCKKEYCAGHRFPTDHNCEKYAKSQKRKENRSRILGTGTTTSRAGWLSGYRSKAQEMFVKKHMVKKNAVGPKNRDIPEENRAYFYVTHVQKGKEAKKGSCVYVDKRWTVGRALDEICELLSIENDNDRFNAEKTYIFLENGEKLEFKWVISDLNPELAMGERIYIAKESLSTDS